MIITIVKNLPEWSMQNSIYFLPGYGRGLEGGLGGELMRRGFSLQGRETVGSLKSPEFQAQIDRIASDLTGRYWSEDARILANSFGGYMFLQTQSLLPPFPGRVLLLSPILGTFQSQAMGRRFSPPRRDRLKQLAVAGEMPMPRCCEVHVGSEDWQSRPDEVARFCALVGASCSIVAGHGHQLGRSHVVSILDHWLR